MIAGQAGDAAAHGDLLAALSRYLRGYFGRRLLGRPADVEDLVQETLLAIHLKRDSYDPAQPFTPWAYAMARYKLLDHFRRTGARKTVAMEDAGVLFAVESVEDGAIRSDLSRLLNRLPERQRHLVHDVKLEGLSLKEAAEKGGYSLTAAKVNLHRALKALSRAVADEDR